MALNNAKLCINCGEHKTNHPTGICSICRDRHGLRREKRLCSECKKIYTYHVSGICHVCRSVGHADTPAEKEHLDSVTLNFLKEDIFILEERKKGTSFMEIAAKMSIPESEVYTRYLQRVSKNLRKNTLTPKEENYQLQQSEQE